MKFPLIIGPVVEDLSQKKVIGWVGEHAEWINPEYLSNEPCSVCDT